VLLVAKIVEEVLVRQGDDFDARLEVVQHKQHEVTTVQAGLECAIENVEYAVPIDDVETRLDDTQIQAGLLRTTKVTRYSIWTASTSLDISAYFAELDQEATEGEEDGEPEEEEEEEEGE